MKKNLTKIMSIILVLVMVVALSGCANEKDAVLGTWKAEVDLADYINEGMASEDEEMAEYLAISSFKLTMVLTFEEDDTYSMSLDEADLDDAMEQLKEDFRAGLERYMQDMIDEMELDMTIDELMEAMGMSMDQLLDETFTDDMMQEIVDSAKSAGKFKVKDGKFYLSAGLNYEVDENVYGNYEVEGNKLTLLDYTGEEDEFLSMYPITFTKAG